MFICTLTQRERASFIASLVHNSVERKCFISMLKQVTWGAVAQWIERATDNRVVARSNPTETAWKLWQFPLPHFASVFRKRH